MMRPLLYCCFFLFIACSSKERSELKPYMSRAEAEKAVEQLVLLGYYKYADAKDVDSLKKELASSIAGYGILSTIYFDRPVRPKDYRYYIFDGETVFEQGGFNDYLNDMHVFFDKSGLKLDITRHIEELDTVSGGIKHELTVNGKLYVIFKDFKGDGWGLAARKFAEMLNDQLRLQNIDERLYLINGGNDGNAVFLSDEQFALIDKLSDDNQSKPLPVEKWAKVFNVR